MLEYKLLTTIPQDELRRCCSNILYLTSAPIWIPFFNSSSQFNTRSFSHRRPSLSAKRFRIRSGMDGPRVSHVKELDAFTDEEYASQSKLLQEFTSMSTIDKAWTFKPTSGVGSHAMFSISQPNLLANKKKKLMLSSVISQDSNGGLNVQWALFPMEVTGASLMVPSPSGAKLLIVRNPENDSPTQFEIWGPFQLEKEIRVPQSVHGSVYADGWFEGVSWSSDESLIAYVAEEPAPRKPTFSNTGYKRDDDKDCSSWKGEGDWEEDWGETYTGKRQPALFVININSGDVCAVEGIGRSLSVAQVVWAPTTKGSPQYLVFVGWPSDTRKFGMKYCFNRPCALYAVRAPLFGSETSGPKTRENDVRVTNLSQGTSSAFFPRFTPDGKFLVFLSAKTCVDSGTHSATNSLHKIEWSSQGEPSPAKILEVVPVVMCPEDGCFPGLYCFNMLVKPWLSDGSTMILSSIWGSTQAILSVNILSGNVSRITPSDSWNLLALDGDNVLAVCSSPVDIPQIKYGSLAKEGSKDATWRWLDVSSPTSECQEKVKSLLSTLQFDILKIPVKNVSENLTKGACKPFEAIYVSSKTKQPDARDPLIVILHGGPHSVSLSSFSKPSGFLASIGYSLLIVNYRGSIGFGEEALQSLPGKAGLQDVNDVLTAVDHAIEMGLANPSKVMVLGGSHGGFLTSHLIGQAPDKFAAAAVRNPVCNLALMVGTSDIPEWCFVESLGREGLSRYTEAPSPQLLNLFHEKSPISHLPKVKTPTLFLLGAKDLRVPVSNGLQFARALKEKGVAVKVIVFPEDMHPIDRPQSDFESFLNIGVWFNKYCK